MGGLHCVEAKYKSAPAPVVIQQSNSDQIVLVDERFHYKKDLMGFLLGAKHTYIVTTTASGHMMKWDKVISGGHKEALRVMEYDADKDHSGVLHRRSVVKASHTEDSLSSFVDRLPKQYDFAEHNCQTHSRAIFNELSQRNEAHLPNGLFLGVWNSVARAILTEEKRLSFQKTLADKYLASTNLRID